MCHAALTCAVLYCVVDQVVLGIRLLAELIWILNSSCLNLWLAQSWPQSKLAGRSTSSSSRSDSVPKRGEARGANPNRSQTHRPWTDRTAANQGNMSRHLHWAMGSSSEEDIDGDGTVPGAALRCAVPCSQNASRNTARNSPRNALRSIPRDTPGNNQRNTLRNTSRNAPTNHPNETPRETPHETPRSTSYESPPRNTIENASPNTP